MLMVKNKIYIYPKLPAYIDLGFIRLGGSGLANCMFIAARAWIKSQEYGYLYINPTWNKFSPGPFLRKESDKRCYNNIFKKYGISGLKKIIIVFVYNWLYKSKKRIIVEHGLANYFGDLIGYEDEIKGFIEKITLPYIFQSINTYNFSGTIGVHIRLGDFPEIHRTDLDWYKSIIKQFNLLSNNKLKFIVFSDGSDSELEEITKLPNVSREFFGSALADIWALSKCEFIIGSDSTFSGWAVYLGQKPCLFAHKHYGKILKNSSLEFIIENKLELSSDLKKIIETI